MKQQTIGKLIPIFMMFILLSGCQKESYSPYSYSNESTIYSETNTTQFRELVFILKPYMMVDNEKKYVVTETIKNINVKINNKLWGVYNSFAIDTSLFISENVSNLNVTNTETKYSIIASYKAESDTLQTAGEYSDLLNNYLTLVPGNYICQIESFEIEQIDGTIRKIKPFIVVPVEVKENSRSAFVGEFEVQIGNK